MICRYGVLLHRVPAWRRFQSAVADVGVPVLWAADAGRAGDGPSCVSSPSPFKRKLLLFCCQWNLKVESTLAAPSGSLRKVFKIEICIIFKLFFLTFLKGRF